MSRSFLKFVLSVIFVAGITSASFAQEDANMAHPNTKAGSAAWLFTINGLGNFGLAGFGIASGATSVVPAAGWKWYFSDDMALRALLGFGTTSTGEADVTKSPGGKTSTTAYGIGVGVELHTHAVYSTSPYFGAQLSFGGAGATNTQTSGSVTAETKNSSTSLGIGVLAGFDWYFTKGLAVGGEYMLGFSTTSSSTTGGTPSVTTDGPSSNNIGISNSGNVHLVVHF